LKAFVLNVHLPVIEVLLVLFAVEALGDGVDEAKVAADRSINSRQVFFATISAKGCDSDLSRNNDNVNLSVKLATLPPQFQLLFIFV